MSTALKWACFLFAAFTELASLSSAENPDIPPSETDMVGAWSGYEGGCVFFYRLLLERQGRGTCHVVFADNTVDSYVVDQWKIKAGKLEMQLSPAKQNQERMKMSIVAFDRLSMEVTVAGVDRDWQRKAVLFNEREFLKKLGKSKRSAKR